MKTRRLYLLALLCIALMACAAGPNDALDTANAVGMVAGFWRGLWHGMIAPVTCVISLFSATINIYEAHNSGGWYNFGFLLGINAVLGGHAAKRSWRKR